MRCAGASCCLRDNVVIMLLRDRCFSVFVVSCSSQRFPACLCIANGSFRFANVLVGPPWFALASVAMI